MAKTAGHEVERPKDDPTHDIGGESRDGGSVRSVYRYFRLRRYDDRDLYSASQWKLVWWRFRKHRLAMGATFILFLYLMMVLFAEFLAPYSGTTRDLNYINGPPEILSFWDDGPARLNVDNQITVRGGVEDGFRYSVVALEGTKAIKWFVQGEEWSILGIFTSTLHLYGVDDYVATIPEPSDVSGAVPEAGAGADAEDDPFAGLERDESGRFQIGGVSGASEGPNESGTGAEEGGAEPELVTEVVPGFVHLLGTDGLGRDQMSRLVYATRTSLTVGIVGLSVAFILGLFFGGVAGYFGGTVDYLIQRLIEIVRSIPGIPLVMALAAAFPDEWSNVRVFFFISIILGLTGWTTLARRVRTMLLTLQDEDYVIAARLSGAKTSRIIIRHMLPTFFSYILVSLIIDFPYMILAESVLSFIGLGLRPPSLSWGVLLQEAQKVEVLEQQPWLLFPAVFVMVAILAFNFFGDGLRDALDPHQDES